jgi:hypothetical protein
VSLDWTASQYAEALRLLFADSAGDPMIAPERRVVAAALWARVVEQNLVEEVRAELEGGRVPALGGWRS